MIRDFTYVTDIVDSIEKLVNKPPKSNSSWNSYKPEANFHLLHIKF